MKKARKTASGDTRSKDLRFRVDEREKAALMAAAEREGLEFSQWARQALLRLAGVLPKPKG